MDKDKLINLLEEQLNLLVKINENGMTEGIEPEQIRKNIETIFSISTYIYSLDRKII